jgi:dihydrofolate synthase/folylpolyglutamate synthase
MPFIHVAGTNGKGSVCAFLTSVFRETGLKVGTFISPHLIDFEERIMVDGRQISREDVTRIGNVLLEQEFGVTPTMFDYCVLMAVLYFKEQNCDLVIMETGLGGRLDSTNALGNPVVSVITRIGYDHMNILGNTIEEIAQEKAGIIKAGVPVVIAPQESEALAVLQRAAAAKGVRARCVQENDLQRAKAVQPGLLGAYQRENAATAMCAAQVAWTGCRIEKEKMKTVIARGIHRAVWPGRMEILSTEPFLMVDGAHNSNGIHALRTSLEELYPEEKFHFVMGVMADKDYEKMIGELLPIAMDFVTVTPESARALQGETLAEDIRKQGVPAHAITKVAEIPELLTPKEKTIALGSLYFIGELKSVYQNRA